MDFNLIFIAITVFFVLNTAVGMLLQSRRRRSSSILTARPGAAPANAVLEISRTIGHLSLNRLILSLGALRRHLDNLLLKNGYPFGWTVETVLVYKEMWVFLAAIMLWQFGVSDSWTWGVSLVASFFMMDLYLSMRGASRRTEMQRELPGYVDLLALTTESGLDLLIAAERIGEKMKPGPLLEEVGRMIQESRLGRPRKEILTAWARRTGLSDAQSLASLINQSDEMGTPLAMVLRSYTEDMRNRRVLRAEELASKIPVKILFPMLLFFFPVIFVIILGPVAVEFLANNGK